MSMVTKMDNNAVIEVTVVFLISFLGFLIVVYNQGRKQAKEFNGLADTFNKSITKLNESVAVLNNTLSFVREEINTQKDRNTTHGKEIDEIDKTVAINKELLKNLSDRVTTIEKSLK